MKERIKSILRPFKRLIVNIRNRFRRKTVLIYCGVHNAGGFGEFLPHYDLAFGFDANLDKVEAARKKFENHPNVQIIHAALSDKDNETITFNITQSWDASSSIGRLNPEFPAYKSEDTALYNTPIKQIEVKTLNLMNFCKQNNIKVIDFLLTDLQGMDVTVLKTLKPFIDQGKILRIQSEVEKDDKPTIYFDINSNKRSEFDKLLGDNYVVIQDTTEPDWWESDITWELKS